MTAPINNPVTLTIDGRSVTVERGTYVIDAARQIGIHIPYFCSHVKLAPDANCRMCLVEVEKMPKLQTSCNLPAADGMVVKSTSDKAEAAHNGVMEFILANHPLDCPLCDQGGECELQDRSHDYSENYSRYTEQKRNPDKRYFGPYIEREMSRCIQCMRCVRYCDEVMDVRAIVPINRGDRVEIGTFMDQELDCEFCGGCVQICPVGAFTSRVALYDYRPWQLKKTETICPYCADGCSLRLESKVATNEVVRVTSDWEKGRNLGDLCAKGYFGYHVVNSGDRLTAPMVRRDGQWEHDYPWIEAMERVASQLSEIKRRHGAQAIGGVISARCTNEEAFLFQKFLRMAVGTPHVDSSARDGHMNAVLALREVVGHGRMSADYDAIEAAQAIMVIGADLSETNPITALRVKAAVRRHGASLVTVGPYLKEIGPVSNLVNLATQPLSVKPGSEAEVVIGLVKAICEKPWVAPATAARAPAYVARVSAAVRKIPWAAIESATGLAGEAIAQAAHQLAMTERAVVLFGQGVTRHAGGYDAVLTLADLAVLAGLYDREGSGLSPVCEEPNEMGVVEMGAAPEFLPGLAAMDDEAARERLRRLWKEEVPVAAGWSLTQMLEQARQGRLKALYLVGEDPLGSLPASANVADALSSLELLVCQDLFFTKTCERAHVVFPAASFAEKDGTFTNHEGRVQRLRRSLEPTGEVMADWEIFSQLSREFGYPLEYASAAELTDEIGRAIPDYLAGLHTAAGPLSRAAGAVDRDALSRYLAGGYEQTVDRRYRAPARSADSGTALIIGQSLFHSGKMSRHAQELSRIEPEGRLQLNPADADRLGVADGEPVRLRSTTDRREAVVPVVRREKIPRGCCLFPGHFPETGVGHLADWSVDPVSHVPYFRAGRVIIEKAVAAASGTVEQSSAGGRG